MASIIIDHVTENIKRIPRKTISIVVDSLLDFFFLLGFHIEENISHVNSYYLFAIRF